MEVFVFFVSFVAFVPEREPWAVVRASSCALIALPAGVRCG